MLPHLTAKPSIPIWKGCWRNFLQIEETTETVLYDSACDDSKLKALFADSLGLRLKTSLNPRRRKELTKGLPRGIAKVTPYGKVICMAGEEMDYKGMRPAD